MKKVFLAAFFAVFVATASIADASVLGGALSFDGIKDFVNDGSAGVFIDDDNDGLADLVQGVVWFDSSGNDGESADLIFSETGGSLFAVYSIALTNTFVSAGLDEFEFSGSGFMEADADSVESLLDIGGATGVQDGGLITRNASVKSSIAIIETTGDFDVLDFRTTNDDDERLALEFDYGSGFTSDLSGFTVSMIAGFDGVDDYHLVEIDDRPRGFFDSAYTVKSDIFGAGVKYKELDGLGGAKGDIVLSDGGIKSPGSSGANGYGFSDEGSYQINAVPEPTSVAIWGVLALGGYGFRRRRRA